MVNTRSSNYKEQEETMSTISNKMKCYIEKLMEPLVTNKSLEGLFSKLKDDLLKNLMKNSLSKMLKLKISNLSYQFMKTKLISYW